MPTIKECIGLVLFLTAAVVPFVAMLIYKDQFASIDEDGGYACAMVVAAIIAGVMFATVGATIASED